MRGGGAIVGAYVDVQIAKRSERHIFKGLP